MKIGEALLRSKVIQTHLKPTHRFKRALEQEGIFPAPKTGETEESYVNKSFETLKDCRALQALDVTVKQMASVIILERSETCPTTKKEEIEALRIGLKEINARCDEMTSWIKSLQRKVNLILEDKLPLTKGDVLVSNKKSAKLPMSPSSIFNAPYQILDLKAVRTKRGFSIGELSRRSGVSKSMISGVERGLYLPSPELLKNLARALRVPLSRLCKPRPFASIPFLKVEDFKKKFNK